MNERTDNFDFIHSFIHIHTIHMPPVDFRFLHFCCSNSPSSLNTIHHDADTTDVKGSFSTRDRQSKKMI